MTCWLCFSKKVTMCDQGWPWTSIFLFVAPKNKHTTYIIHWIISDTVKLFKCAFPNTIEACGKKCPVFKANSLTWKILCEKLSIKPHLQRGSCSKVQTWKWQKLRRKGTDIWKNLWLTCDMQVAWCLIKLLYIF